MLKILDENTINKIAAGEVVERPCNIVKELIENSVDANATKITIEIKNGGISFIRVIDDGFGIEKKDLKIAFKKHATSKIEKVEDIYNIDTFGFRGEALPSIAGVSKVNIVSKIKTSNVGYVYNIDFGKEGEIKEIASLDGTDIKITNLFDNLPVRKKFLKTEAVEKAKIQDIIEKEALAHSEISFKFIDDGKVYIHTSGDNVLKNVIYEIYGKDVYNNLLHVSYNKLGIKIFGYVVKPFITKNNRNDEVYFVSNRYIKNKFIQSAIEDAYKPYLMQHKYPIVFLNILLDKKTFDINVHPKKEEVRFSDNSRIYASIFEAVSSVLKQNEMIVESSLIDDNVSNLSFIDRHKKELDNYDLKKLDTAIFNKIIDNKQEKNIDNKQEKIFDGFIPYKEVSELNYKNNIDINTKTDFNTNSEFDYKNSITNDISLKNNDTQKNANKFDSKNIFSSKIYDEEKNKFVKSDITTDYKFIGQIFDTYILIEYEDKLYVIDQHAAHEKINFEKLKKMYDEKLSNSLKKQSIFPSIILSLNSLQIAVVKENIDIFNKLGFEIEQFGEKDIKVSSVPYDLPNIARDDLLLEIIDDFSKEANSNNISSIIDRLATIACKKSVKANNKLSIVEMKELISNLFKLENPYNCPHGRPTIISITSKEFEKKFGRIV